MRSHGSRCLHAQRRPGDDRGTGGKEGHCYRVWTRGLLVTAATLGEAGDEASSTTSGESQLGPLLVLDLWPPEFWECVSVCFTPLAGANVLGQLFQTTHFPFYWLSGLPHRWPHCRWSPSPLTQPLSSAVSHQLHVCPGSAFYTGACALPHSSFCAQLLGTPRSLPVPIRISGALLGTPCLLP